MKRWFVIFSIAIIYYAVAAYSLYVTDTGLVVTALALYAFPSVILAHYSHAPTAVILSVASLGIGLGVMLESIAHIYGLWYTLGFEGTRLLGLVPIESIMAIMFQTLFLVLLYELFFDDGVYTMSSVRDRMVAFFIFVFAVIVLLFIHQYWFSGFFLNYSYVWIIGIIAASCIAALGVYRVYSVRFFDKLINFTALGAIPGTIFLFLAISNSHRFFANPDQYLYTWQILGEMVPLEEILLVVAIPFLVGTVYELYLDDKS